MKALKVILVLLILILLAEVGFLAYDNFGHLLFDDAAATEATVTQEATTEATEEDSLLLPPAVTQEPTEEVTEAPTTEATEATTEATTEAPTQAATEELTEAPTEAPTEKATEAPTEEATEAPTEAATEEPTEATKPGTEVFLLSFAGNCVFGGAPSDNSSASFTSVVGDDYGHPFRNVESIFKEDEFTFLTLECVLADSGDPTQSGHVFRGPKDYAKILTAGSVEAVSIANDHTDDFGQAGYDSTKAALEAENIQYAEKNDYLVYTTKNGLKIGVFAVSVKFERWPMQQAINAMKKEGADIIIVAFHWGENASYAPNMTQINAAHCAIDNGADLVIGTNPQYLQGIEYYKHGLICYSLGNFSYGGNKWPTDLDSTIIQQELLRDASGKVTLGDAYIIPCSMTSSKTGNNFQPNLLEVDSWQYNSVLKKLTEPIWDPDYQ